VLVGTVNPDNNQHAANENLRVLDFVNGIRTMAAILTEPLGDPGADNQERRAVPARCSVGQIQ
jgi:hypothetical protein